MRHPLETRIAALRGRARRVVAAHGLGRLVLGAILAVALAASLDWLVPLVPEVRLALLVVVLATITWILVRSVIAPLVVRFNDLDIALRIEDRWPGLNDRLASTVQFLRQPAGVLDSQALRDETVAQAIREADAIDFRQAVDPRPARRSVAVSSLAIVGAGLLVALAPATALTALDRLFRPYGPTEWPRSTHLTFLDAETPARVARGEPFTLAVGLAPGDRMPSSARATYTFADGETAEEALRPGDDRTFRGRLDVATRDFSVVVAAGDDQTEPRAVTVVPPPVLTELTVKVIPPPYTGLPPQTLGEGNTQAKAVFGSKIELAGKANKPLASAVLKVGDAPSADPATVAPGGLAVAAAFPAAATVPFWFELKDTEGFKNREPARYDLRTVADEAPRLSFDEPTTDRDVPARAVVPLRIAAEDDHGLHSVRLVYKVSAGGSEPPREVIVPLWDGQARPAGVAPSRKEAVAHRWDLGPMKLEPGSIVSYHADARDFDDVKGPNIGKSRELRLRIISDEDAQRQIEELQRALRDDIDRTRAMQRQARSPVDEAKGFLAKAGTVPTPAREGLKNAETIQRQVSSRVANTNDGIERKVDQILNNLSDFNIPNADVERQMREMKAAVERLKERNLTPAERGLAAATKALEDGPKPDPAADAPGGAEDKARPEAGDQAKAGVRPKDAKSSAGDQAKPKAEAGDPATGEPGREAKAPAGDQAKGQAGQQAKGQAGQPKAGESKPSPADPAQPKPAADDAAKPAEQALAQAATNQKAIADELDRMSKSMGEFDTYRGLIKDAKAQLQNQEQALKNSGEAAARPDLAGKAADALTPEQKAEMDNLGARQAEIAKAQRDLEGKLDEMARKQEADDPMGAAALREAARASRQAGTAAKMADAAEQINKNQVGQGRENQEKARNDLKEMINSLENRRERELARLVQELKQAEADLKDLRARQSANLKKTAAARAMTDPKARERELQKLAKEQQAIQKELKRQLQKLAKLGADGAARAADKAAGAMSKAEGDLNKDDGEKAEDDMEEALDDLRQAQRDLAQNRREAEEGLAMEQIAKMADALRSIHERQEKTVGETVGYEKARTAAGGKLSLAQRSGVRDLGRVQSGLKDEAGELIERLGEGAPVFTLTLRRASDAMDEAAARLRDFKTDDPTLVAERSAASRFRQLLDALKPDKMKKKDGEPDDPGAGGGAGGGQQQGDGIPAAAQIKVLKMLQEEINDRTDAFDKIAARKGELTPEQVRERDRLHEDQGALADLVRDLTQPRQPEGDD